MVDPNTARCFQPTQRPLPAWLEHATAPPEPERAHYTMRLRTPVSQIKKSSKSWTISPPTAKGIPLQECRPNIQRGGSLELFEPSPEQLRYSGANRSPFDAAVKPKHPIQQLRNAELTKSRRSEHKCSLASLGLSSLLVLSVASLHLINFGNHSFNKVLSDKTAFATFSRGIAPRKPRVFFMGESADFNAPRFPPTKRTLVLYSSDEDSFTDVTQLYDRKDSNDEAIKGSMERKFFPMHETNKDCIPRSSWQSQSFPTCNRVHEMGIVSSLQDDTLRLLSSSGSWRDAWRLRTKSTEIPDNIVIKTIK